MEIDFLAGTAGDVLRVTDPRSGCARRRIFNTAST
jgi:hypothetical protein